MTFSSSVISHILYFHFDVLRHYSVFGSALARSSFGISVLIAFRNVPTPPLTSGRRFYLNSSFLLSPSATFRYYTVATQQD